MIEGLREIDKIKEAKMTPTPIATPTKARIVILEAKYRNPRRILSNVSLTFQSTKKIREINIPRA